MSYKVPVVKETFSQSSNQLPFAVPIIKLPSWYNKSMGGCAEFMDRREIDRQHMFSTYELLYRVKLDVDDRGYIRNVIFPDESTAIMFLLRWS